VLAQAYGLTWQSLARVRSKLSGRSRSVIGLRRAHARATAYSFTVVDQTL